MRTIRAVVLRDELGAIGWSLEESGVEVAALYTDDKKEAEICRRNLNGNVIQADPFQSDLYIPEADIIAGKVLYRQSGKGGSRKEDIVLSRYLEIIRTKKPGIILLEARGNALSDRSYQKFLQDIREIGYDISCQKVDIREMTGYPVHESKVYAVGFRNGTGISFRFPSVSSNRTYKLEDICRIKDVMDPWYLDVGEELPHSLMDRRENAFLCWKGKGYAETEVVYWNTIKIPLVRENGIIRKITHREIARLKGYPDQFILDGGGRSWLYKKLMYSSSIPVIRSLIKAVQNADGTFYRDIMPSGGQERRERQFERLMETYARYKNMDIERKRNAEDFGVDLVIRKGNQVICIDSKLYTSNVGVESKIVRVCEQRSLRAKERSMKYFLAIGNFVHDDTKELVQKEYGIGIWDVRNLLWMFEEFPDVKSEFISLLNFTTGNLIPQKPEGDFFLRSPETEKNEEKRAEALTSRFEERLQKIKPGPKQFSLYEDICTEILKAVLGDYLERWEKQAVSNDGLYRFDLWCKIKHGIQPEFFDTVKTFFHTKYVVFEFKNYQEPITQKEIYSTEKYLYQKALRSVAIIVSRKGASEHALTAARGCLRENGKLILCLSDDDLLKMLAIKNKREQSAAEYLIEMLDNMLINLEK